MDTTWKKEDRPYNLEEILESDISKYKKLKEGDDIKSGDCVYIFNEIYAVVSKGNLLCKQKATKHVTILRKK